MQELSGTASKLAQTWVKENSMPLGTEKSSLLGTAGVAVGGARGLFMGGTGNSAEQDVIEYINISSTGNTTDFGDLITVVSNCAATSNGATDRAILGGGYHGSSVQQDQIQYVTISSAGDAVDFGDLSVGKIDMAAVSNGTDDRGVFGGGSSAVSAVNVMEYVTISSTGNVTDFGDLTSARRIVGGASNATDDRGLFAGGRTVDHAWVNTVGYIAISSAGNATDFGDLSQTAGYAGGCSNGTSERAIFTGFYNGSWTDAMDYFTINSAGDATDFGNLSTARSGLGALSNGTDERGVFGGGYSAGAGPRVNVIDYVTISSAGDAADFGDLLVAKNVMGAASNA